MNRQDPTIRELLAAEYVIGLLQGLARARFESLLTSDASLRRLVAIWEARLTPLAERLQPVRPPEITWQTIRQRTGLDKSARVPWTMRVELWRWLAITSATVALALAVYIGVTPRLEEAPSYVAVLTDEKAQPAVLVTSSPSGREIRVRGLLLSPPGPNRALELWLLPAPGQAPVSLGLVPLTGVETIALARTTRHQITEGAGLAVSLEPSGGSPTGQPTGPILYQGKLLVQG